MADGRRYGRYYKAPTQSDVARAAGVSQATVSAVVSGRSTQQRIPDETTQHVLAAARQLGYVANAAARSLKGKRNQLLGVHTFESVFPISRRDFYHEFLVGIEEQAVAEGYDLVLFTSTQEPDGRRQVYRRGANRLNVADGSVLLGVERGHADLARLAADGYPFVHVGRRDVPGADIAWVGADYAGAVETVVTRLAEAGHTRLAYLADIARNEPQDDRFHGYRRGCSAAGLSPTASFVEPAAVTGEWLRELTAAGVTALLLENDAFTHQLSELIRTGALTASMELTVVFLAGVDAAPAVDQSWCGIGIPRNEMGRAAVRLLVAMLTDPDGPHQRQLLLPCEPPAPATIRDTIAQLTGLVPDPGTQQLTAT